MPPRALVLLVAAASCLAGCGDRACFRWEAHEGTCPSQEEALPFMTPPPGPFGGTPCREVQSVESDGEFDEDAGMCCYDVVLMNQDNDYSCCNGICE